MEHIDYDYLSTQVIQIPSKRKTSFSSSFIFKKSPELSIPALCLQCKMSYREVARERRGLDSTQFLMTHLQISAIRPTLEYASADCYLYTTTQTVSLIISKTKRTVKRHIIVTCNMPRPFSLQQSVIMAF